MTQPVGSARAVFAGSGSYGPFTVPFFFYQNTDVVVFRILQNGTRVQLALATDYKLSGANTLNGSLTLITANPLLGVSGASPAEILVIERATPRVQDINGQVGVPVPSTAILAKLDSLVRMIQELDDAAARALALTDTLQNTNSYYDAKLANIRNLAAPALPGDAVNFSTLLAYTGAAKIVNPFAAPFRFGDGSFNLLAGMAADIIVPYACTLSAWTIVLGGQGSVTFDVQRAAGVANLSNIASIVNGANPSLSNAQGVAGSTNGWSVQLNAFDVVRAVITSVSAVSRAAFVLTGTR